MFELLFQSSRCCWIHFKSHLFSVNWISESEEIFLLCILQKLSSIWQPSETKWNWSQLQCLARVTKHCGPWQRQASRHSNEFTYSEFPCSVKVKFDDPASSYCHWSVEKAKDFPWPLTWGAAFRRVVSWKALSRGRDLPISFEYFRFPPALIYITFILNGESL